MKLNVFPRQRGNSLVTYMAEIVEGDLATKQDIKELKDEMQKLEYRLVIKLTSIMAAMFTLATGIAVALLRYQIE